MKNKHQKITISSQWHVEHWRGDDMISERVEENICPNAYIDHVLDVVHSGGTAVATWYVALFSDNHTPAAGDTYATPGYTEATSYDEATRPVWTEAGVSSQSITNSASKANFTMNGNDASIYGAALVSSPTPGNTAATGNVLGPVSQFSGGAISGISDDDVLKIYITISGSDV